MNEGSVIGGVIFPSTYWPM